MYAVEFVSQTRKKHRKLDNYRIKYFAKTSCHQVSDSTIAYSNLKGIFNTRLTSLWDFPVFICNIRLTCQVYMYMLRFHFILGLCFIFLCFGVWLYMIISLKRRKIKFKPRIKIEPKHIHQEVELLPTVEVIA